MTKQEIKKLSERDHIRSRPSMYLGQISLGTYNEWVYSENSVRLQEVQYVPALIKIINEIIDNSVDEAIKTNFEFSNKISVTIESDKVSVQDNGRGIPVEKNSDGQYYGELCWLHARAGSNFNDDDNQAQLGTNGVGSFATAVFSKKFTGETDDGKASYKVIAVDGVSSFKETIGTSKSRGTKVSFEPDLDAFGLSEIDETHINLIKTRLQNLSLTYPDVEFKFNGKKISFKSKKEFLKLFGESYELIESDEYFFAVFPNEEDDFKQFSYMNGLRLPSGGTHIDIITQNVVSRVRDSLVKKFKTIKPGDIRNKLLVVMVGKGFKKLKFDSQTKEKITNSVTDTNEYLGSIDWDSLSKKILKNKNIIDPITEVYRIKEELKRRQEMKSLEGKPKEKIKSEKYTRAVGENNMLVICEGQSARSGILPSLGRNGVAYYELKGKILNVQGANQTKFTQNKELSELYKIIKQEGFKKFIFAADKDLDGVSINGLLLSFFQKYIPDALVENRCYILDTPIASKMKDKKPIKWVYDYQDIHTLGDKDIKFYKGMGSWKPEDLKYVISVDGLDRMLRQIEYNKEIDDIAVFNWYLSENTDYRKIMIKNNDFDLIKL